MVASACTKPVQVQVRPNPNMERGVAHEISPSAVEHWQLLAAKIIVPPKSTKLHWKTTHTGIFGQHKYVSMGLICY